MCFSTEQFINLHCMQLSSRNIFSQKLAFFSDENRLMTAKANGLNIQSLSDRVYSHHSATQMLVTLLFLNEFSQFKVRQKVEMECYQNMVFIVLCEGTKFMEVSESTDSNHCINLLSSYFPHSQSTYSRCFAK